MSDVANRTSPTAYEAITYEVPAPGVARIMLDRPEVANAQNKQMLYELNDAFDVAVADDEVKVIILGANGKHFSSGHDLRDGADFADFDTVMPVGGFTQPGAHGMMAREEEVYLGFCQRWRVVPKPTIAQVQGKVIAGGLMLVWPCDLVVASDDASFSDPVVAFGVNGVEYFAHAFELGPRRAKELLFTGEAMGAEEAKAIGMVNRVVPETSWRPRRCPWPSGSPPGRPWAQAGQDVGQPVGRCHGLPRRPAVGLRAPTRRPRPQPVVHGWWSTRVGPRPSATTPEPTAERGARDRARRPRGLPVGRRPRSVEPVLR